MDRMGIIEQSLAFFSLRSYKQKRNILFHSWDLGETFISLPWIHIRATKKNQNDEAVPLVVKWSQELGLGKDGLQGLVKMGTQFYDGIGILDGEYHQFQSTMLKTRKPYMEPKDLSSKTHNNFIHDKSILMGK